MFAHIDADAFFASVLVRSNPSLRGKPLIAAGMGGGCVIAASYPAKALGVKTGMPISEAKKLVPRDAIIRHTDFAEAHTASEQIETRLSSACADLEMTSIDEWYADLRGVPGGVPTDLYEWAKRTQDDVLHSTGLDVSFGIAPTKLLAKMASPYRKPKGITVVMHEGDGHERLSEHTAIIKRETFLQSLKADDIPGIGWRRSVHVESLGLKTAWDVAHMDRETSVHLFGRPGLEMVSELQGVPVHRVVTEEVPPKSVSRCRSFPRTRDIASIRSHLLTHLSYMVLKMRRLELGCEDIGIWLRNGEYQYHDTHTRLPQTMTTEEQLMPYVNDLLKRLLRTVTLFTQAGLVLGGLKSTRTVQYSLFEATEETNKAEGLQKALDTLRTQFGRDAVRRGGAVGTKKLTRRLLTREGS